MQDFSVNAAVWITPDFAQAGRHSVDETAGYEVDEASLAQFEALLPMPKGEGVDGQSADAGASEIGGVGGVGGVGGPATTAFAAETSPGEASGRPRDAGAPQPDAVVSSYTIHHARLGVVHVEQSTGGSGAVGAVTLRTDDEALRERLRNAMPALRGALAGGDGRGPDVSVDA